MPWKKKKNCCNGFICFTEEWLSNRKDMTFKKAIPITGDIWRDMTEKEKEPYKELAKLAKGEKLTCAGVKLSERQQQERDKLEAEHKMKWEIERVVREVAGNPKDLANLTFCMMAANFFTKFDPLNIYPAEISIAKFSLASGVHGVYHTYVKPKQDIYSFMFAAKNHSESTHKLPLPPNAMGQDNYETISKEITEFLCDKDGKSMPIYTLQDEMPMVISVLDNIMAGYKDDNAESLVRVSSLNHLLYVLKEACCELRGLPKQSSIMTDNYLSRDCFEYQNNISCAYHEKIDCCKWCTTNCVTRWGYMFAKYLCSDIGIKMKRGRHMPLDAYLNVEFEDDNDEMKSEEKEQDDVMNMGAMSIAAQLGSKEECNNATLSVSNYDIKAEDVKVDVKAQKRGDNTTVTSLDIQDMDDDCDDMNHWETVSKKSSSTNASTSMYDFTSPCDLDVSDDMNPWETVSKKSSSSNASTSLLDFTSASTMGYSNLLPNSNRRWGRGNVLLQFSSKR